jgi:F0F1-type ATP synthase membrane subunit c/vacuolar-type H+-ATPase subunit K
VRAQEQNEANEGVSYGVANYVVVSDENVEDGHIVSAMNQQFKLSTIPFDENMAGVVTTRPAISFIDSDTEGKTPIITSGNGYVLVSGKSGPILKGDPITTSDVPGVGVKATENGNIIGSALEDFTPSSGDEIKKISVKIDIRFYSKEVGRKSVFDVVKLSLLNTAKDQPPIFFKYLTAALVVLGSTVLGFNFFGRVAAKGIEAIGRNPLAGKMIQFGIVLNVIITVITISAGLIVAIVILRI